MVADVPLDIENLNQIKSKLIFDISISEKDKIMLWLLNKYIFKLHEKNMIKSYIRANLFLKFAIITNSW